MLLPVLSKSVMYVWFELNQEYIAENLCINKDNEEREDCKGCCYLNDQIKKVETQTETPNTPAQKVPTQKKESNWEYFLGISEKDICIPSKQFTFLAFLSKQQDSQYLAAINKPPCWIFLS
jgi:hypothetical protein